MLVCMYVWHNCRFTLHLCDVACDCTWLFDNTVSAAVLHISGVLLIDNDMYHKDSLNDLL